MNKIKSIKENVTADTFSIEKSYWVDKGEEQQKYKELMDAVDSGKYELTKGTLGAFRRYYRFYNDGDAPSRIKYLEKFYSPKALEKNKEYLEYCAKLENAVTDAVIKEHAKMLKKISTQNMSESTDLNEDDGMEHWVDITVTGGINDEDELYELLDGLGEVGADFEVLDSEEGDDYPVYTLRVRKQIANDVENALNSEFYVLEVHDSI